MGLGGHTRILLGWRIILTSGLQIGHAHERLNTRAAALTCSLFLFSSHIFCTVFNPPPQQTALYRASACHCSAPPQWPDSPRIVLQDNIDQKKVSKPSGALGKHWMCCHVRQHPSGCSGSNHLFTPGPENWKLMLTTVLSNVHGTLSHCHWLELMWRSFAQSHASFWLLSLFIFGMTKNNFKFQYAVLIALYQDLPLLLYYEHALY